MQWLARVCVRRPVFTWVLMLSLLVIGAASYGTLGVDRFPNVEFPVVVVSTVLPGASPEQVETEVSDRIEESVNSISGLTELRSNSYEGLSVVFANFELEKDGAEAAQEVRDRVNQVLTQLPDGAMQPMVQRIDPGALPVMLVALSSHRSAREVTEYARREVRQHLETVSGVGGVTILGGQEREVQVRMNLSRMASLGLTARDVQRALATENVEIPGGDVDEGARTLQLRVQGRIDSVEGFRRIPVAQRAGRTVLIGDVAEVVDSEAELHSAATLNGEQVVIIAIRKQSGSNTVAVVDGLRERIEEIRETLPASYQLRVVRDESEFSRNAVEAVEEHLVLGGLFAALVVLLFLRNGRSTVIAALAIPTSIISTFALLKVMDLTLNTITLLGLTLSVGIVIDDAIVVLENIVRFLEQKRLSPRKAAVLATQEIGLAVLATTLSLVAVFLPIAFMGGIVGRFMSSFGFTMSFAILVSLFVAFSLTPMLSSRWLKGPIRPKDEEEPELDPEELVEEDDLEIPDPVAPDRAEERTEYAEWLAGKRALHPDLHGGEHEEGGAIYKRLEKAYLRLLAFCMRHRWVVGLMIALAFVGIVPLGILVDKNFLPVDDESRFEIDLRAPEGYSLEHTQLVGERLARQIRERGGISHTVLTVGSPEGDFTGRGANQASLFVALVPPGQRRRTQEQIMTEVREHVTPAFRAQGVQLLVTPVNAFGGGGSDSAPIQYVLSGPELDRLAEYSAALLERAQRIPGAVDVGSTLISGRPSYEVRIHRDRAADLGVSIADVANALRMAVGGVVVTSYNDAGQRYDVRLRAEVGDRNDPESIAQIAVPVGMTGRTVSLGDVARIERSEGPATVRHVSRQRQVTIYASVGPGASEAEIIEQFEQARQALHMAPGYRGQLAGRSKELGKASRAFVLAFGLSLLFMYLVLAAQFESWLHPLTILLSLPLTIPFALFSLIVLGQSVNIFSSLGILVLFGIVKKNSILQVDHMRQLRRKGHSRADSVMVGNRDRLRPILMTTIAFVAGMLPLFVSTGAGSGTNRAMSSVIIGGQTLALLLTLLATPVMYTWLDDISSSRAVKWTFAVVAWPALALDRFVSKKPAHEEERPAAKAELGDFVLGDVAEPELDERPTDPPPASSIAE